MSGWGRYVDFMREEEAPESLALGRICFGAAITANAAWPLLAGNAVAIYADPAHGGVFPGRVGPLTLFNYVEGTEAVVLGVLGLNVLAGLAFTAGFATRAMAAVLLVLHMSLSVRLGWFGFGADEVVRVFTFPMLLANLGAAASVDARLGLGADRVAAWPRRLILFQITVLYVTTGMVKFGSTWSFVDGWSALYYALNLPYFARFDGSWAAWVYPLTQVGTFVSRWWETLFFVLPLSMFLARHPERGGRVRRWLATHDLRPVMLGIGVILHLGLALSMDLGMFPWLMLALYPFFLEPEEARRVLDWAGLGARPVSTGTAGS